MSAVTQSGRNEGGPEAARWHPCSIRRERAPPAIFPFRVLSELTRVRRLRDVGVFIGNFICVGSLQEIHLKKTFVEEIPISSTSAYSLRHHCYKIGKLTTLDRG